MLFLIGLQAALIGIGATLIMDLWAWLQRRVFGIPSLNYALVARWVLCMPKGKLVHAPIMSTDPMPGEKALGWFYTMPLALFSLWLTLLFLVIIGW